MATNHATTAPISFQTQNLTTETQILTGLDHLDAWEKDQLKQLLDRRELFGIPITDGNNKALTEIAWTLKHWPTGFTVKKEELHAIAAEEEGDVGRISGAIA